MIRSSACFAFLAVFAVGCDKGDKAPPPGTASASAALSASPPDASADAAKPEAVSLITTWGKDQGFQTPECVLHDEVSDLYFVSNVQGKPLEADGKAFISKVAPEAMGLELKFIEGGKKGVTLNAPKGMTFTGDTLWVADIDTVRMFDRKTGAPLGEVKIPGATFLNDMATAADGTTVLVTDTGMKAEKDGSFKPAGNDAVYSIDAKKKLTPLAKTKDLANPNGIFVDTDTKVWVVSFGGNMLYQLDLARSQPVAITRLPKGSLDGITMFDRDFLVSSWEGKAIYRGRPGGDFVPIIQGLNAPADIMFDKKRNRLIVPLFQDDEIRAYALK